MHVVQVTTAEGTFYLMTALAGVASGTYLAAFPESQVMDSVMQDHLIIVLHEETKRSRILRH